MNIVFIKPSPSEILKKISQAKIEVVLYDIEFELVKKTPLGRWK